jgi:hypothetical protein
MTSKSAMENEPAWRRNIRKSANITRYIIVPRMIISNKDSVGTNTDCQST